MVVVVTGRGTFCSTYTHHWMQPKDGNDELLKNLHFATCSVLIKEMLKQFLLNIYVGLCGYILATYDQYLAISIMFGDKSSFDGFLRSKICSGLRGLAVIISGSHPEDREFNPPIHLLQVGQLSCLPLPKHQKYFSVPLNFLQNSKKYTA